MARATLTQSAAELQRRFTSAELEALFEACFGVEFRTRLQGGATEPFYQPASADSPARLCYTRDYFRSALHEVAHWCVAGAARRQLPDFGYWYAADGRNAAEQALFQQVEVAPQALELLFCAACGHPFRVSLDNLEGECIDPQPFERAVLAAARQRLAKGLSGRVGRWCQALSRHYRQQDFQPAWLEEVFLPL